MLSLHFDDHPANGLPVLQDLISLAFVDGCLNRLAGNNLAFFLEVIVPSSEFLQGAVIERFLIIPDKLLPVLINCSRSLGGSVLSSIKFL